MNVLDTAIDAVAPFVDFILGDNGTNLMKKEDPGLSPLPKHMRMEMKERILKKKINGT